MVIHSRNSNRGITECEPIGLWHPSHAFSTKRRGIQGWPTQDTSHDSTGSAFQHFEVDISAGSLLVARRDELDSAKDGELDCHAAIELGSPQASRFFVLEDLEDRIVVALFINLFRFQSVHAVIQQNNHLLLRKKVASAPSVAQHRNTQSSEMKSGRCCIAHWSLMFPHLKGLRVEVLELDDLHEVWITQLQLLNQLFEIGGADTWIPRTRYFRMLPFPPVPPAIPVLIDLITSFELLLCLCKHVR